MFLSDSAPSWAPDNPYTCVVVAVAAVGGRGTGAGGRGTELRETREERGISVCPCSLLPSPSPRHLPGPTAQPLGQASGQRWVSGNPGPWHKHCK